MSAIILMDADDPEYTSILLDDNFNNRVFKSVEDADMWRETNGQIGWVTRIIDCDD